MFVRIGIALGILLLCNFLRIPFVVDLFCLLLVGGYVLTLEILLKRERKSSNDENGEDTITLV